MRYVIYWLGSKRASVVDGRTIQEACTNAGYGGGITRAIDYYAEEKLGMENLSNEELIEALRIDDQL